MSEDERAELERECQDRGFSSVEDAAQNYGCMDDCEQHYGKWFCCRVRAAHRPGDETCGTS